MKKFYILLVLCTFIFMRNNAQTINGTITDKNTNEALIGVNILLENNGGTATNWEGKYQLQVDEGEQKITFRYIGYEEIIKTISLQKNESIIINVELTLSSEQLKTVVVSAGKYEQKIEEITISMEVIKPSLIENKNTTDIQTVMDQIPGVNITDGQANIRGGSGWSYGAGTRVLVLVDDMPLISGDAGQVQWKLIATENIHQVEVIKGAASALYGSSALNGIINIRTAFPSQKAINKNTTSFFSRNLPGFTKVNMHMGLVDKPQRAELNWNGEKRRAFKGIEFLHAMKIKNLDLSLGGNIFKDDGYRLGEVTDRKRFNINSTYKSKKYEGLSYGINANFLSQESGSVMIWKGLDAAYLPSGEVVTTTSGSTYNIDPFITYMKGNNRHSLRTRYLNVINDNSTGDADAGQDNESETFYSDYQWQKNLEKYNLRITNGFTNEIVYARSDLFNGNNTRKNHSLYSQLDKKIGRVNLSFGARYEAFKIQAEEKYFIDGKWISSFSESKPVLRAGLNYQLAEATYLRASWGQGFRFPSMAELFISTNQSGLEIYPNAALKPESGWSSELGIKQGVKMRKWMGYLDLAAFLMQYDNMMEFSFGRWGTIEDPMAGIGFKSVNVGKTQVSGIEFSATGQGRINNNITMNILAGYTYMRPISLSPEEPYAYNINDITGDTLETYTYNSSSSDSTVLKYRYQHIAKIDAEVVYKKLSIGASFRYNNFMRNIDKIFTSELINGGPYDLDADGIEEFEGIPGINDAREKFKDGDFIIDARIGWQLNDIIRFGFVVNNLLNREYMSRPANMMPPRTFAIQCNLKV